MLEFKFEKGSLKAAQDIVDEVDRFIDSLEPFFRGPALRVMKKVFMDLFRTEGAVAGTQKWAPLKPATRIARYKRFHRTKGKSKRKNPSTKILWDTGRMRRSYTKNPTVKITRGEMRIGSNVPYAKYHETGTRYMPARPVLGHAAIIARSRLTRALNKYFRTRLSGQFGTKYNVIIQRGS